MSFKIAIVANTSWYLYNFRTNLMLAFKQKGNQVIAIAPKDEYSDKLLEAGFDGFYHVGINSKGHNPFEDVVTIYHFYKLYKKIEPDVVCHYTPKPNIYGSIAAKRLKIPVINNIAGLGSLFTNINLITKIAEILYRKSQRNADLVFFQNKDDFNLFKEKRMVERENCDILPGSGVDVKKFTVNENNKNEEKLYFLLIARLLWDKGVGEFVEAAAIIKSKYPDTEFQLLGFLDVKNPSAISTKQMNEWVNQGLVSYLGTTDDIRPFIQKSDCVVLPSYYREGVPRSLLEAAASGKPIITTDSIGCKEVVDDGINGYLCKPKDVNDLVKKIEQMINLSAEDRKKMGLAGRKKMVNEFDENIVINKYLNAIALKLMK